MDNPTCRDTFKKVVKVENEMLSLKGNPGSKEKNIQPPMRKLNNQRKQKRRVKIRIPKIWRAYIIFLSILPMKWLIWKGILEKVRVLENHSNNGKRIITTTPYLLLHLLQELMV